MRLLLGIAILFALPGSALAKSVPDAAGRYEINQMEMAGGLHLLPNGRFLYTFDYGAVSEESEGRWVSNGTGVSLTSDLVPPSYLCDRGFAQACFNKTPLTAEGDNLILIRWDTRIVFKPVQPRPR